MDNHSIYQLRALIIQLASDWLLHHEEKRDQAEPDTDEHEYHEAMCDLLISVVEAAGNMLPKWVNDLERVLYHADRG